MEMSVTKKYSKQMFKFENKISNFHYPQLKQGNEIQVTFHSGNFKQKKFKNQFDLNFFSTQSIVLLIKQSSL